MHIGAYWCEIISKVVDSRFLLDSYLRQKQFKFLIQNTVVQNLHMSFLASIKNKGCKLVLNCQN